MTTPVWLTGFEHGVASANGGGLFDTVSGTTVQGTLKRTGGYALQADCTSSQKSARKALTSGNLVVARIYIHMGGTLPNGDCNLIRLNTAGHYITLTFANADSKLYFGRDGAKTTASTSTVTTGTWYRLDFRANTSANPWTVDWSIDGIAQTQFSSAHAAEAMDRIDLGLITDSVTGTITYDDVIVSLTTGDYPIGAGQIDALLPNSDGTHNNAANTMEDAAGNDIDGVNYYAWQQVDELPMSDTGSRIQQATAGTDKYVEVQFADQASAYTAYHGISAILAYQSATTTANEGGCVVRRSDATEITVWGNGTTRADYSETSMFYKSAIVTTPGGGWTQAEVNALRARMGYSNDVSPVPYWYNLMIEVAHSGVLSSSIKKAAGVAQASIKKAAGVALASIKKMSGVSNV